MDQSGLKTGIDQTDHAPPYRHEITISVGGESFDTINIKSPAIITPTPSPRSTQSSHVDEISTHSTDDDNAILTPTHKTIGDMNKPNGVENPAFENDTKTSQQRPLSSFGQNGSTTAINDVKDQMNGKEVDKPLAGKIFLFFENLLKFAIDHNKFIFHSFLLFHSNRNRSCESRVSKS